VERGGACSGESDIIEEVGGCSDEEFRLVSISSSLERIVGDRELLAGEVQLEDLVI
jgi:hypothetical protein